MHAGGRAGGNILSEIEFGQPARPAVYEAAGHEYKIGLLRPRIATGNVAKFCENGQSYAIAISRV
jgi:hypothetical protein